MSTNGFIARRVDETTIRGVYHHWDSYPSGLGATLHELYHGHFGQDVAAMQRVLIDEHPAGWSTINGKDFDLEPGFQEYGNPSQSPYIITDDYERIDNPLYEARPNCYCHGDRHEGPQVIECRCETGESCGNTHCEWGYVLTEHGMEIWYLHYTGEEREEEYTNPQNGATAVFTVQDALHRMFRFIEWGRPFDGDAIENEVRALEVEA